MDDKIDINVILNELNDKITADIDNPGAVSGNYGYELGYGPTPTYSYGDDTITLSSYPWSNASITNTSITGGGYTVAPNVTIGSGIYTTGTNASPWFSTSNSTKIKLDGEGADIEVNGWSLINAIQKIEERLNILHPNTELETEWEELRALGEQYRKLEQHIKDKQATWDKLKAMPPPAID
jgi:hypothetical protein